MPRAYFLPYCPIRSYLTPLIELMSPMADENMRSGVPLDSGTLPFFESGGAGGARGHLLGISNHFPPSPATGALRWQKFSHHAAERGWSLDVISVDPRALERPEWERLEDLPRGIRLFGVPEPGPSSAERLIEGCWATIDAFRRRARAPGDEDDVGNQRQLQRQTQGAEPRSLISPRPTELRSDEVRWLSPDTRTPVRAYFAWLSLMRERRWARAATELVRRLTREGSGSTFDAVISCGPPQMVHDAGRRIARALGVPLVLDFRDPWSLTPRLPESYASPLWYLLARKYERKAMDQVGDDGLIIMNTEAAREAISRLYPSLASRTITVMNGYDVHDPAPLVQEGRRFLIAYAGTIYMGRDPRPLFRAVAQLIDEFGLEPDDIGVELIGDVMEFDGVPTDELAVEEGIGEYLSLRPRVPRREVHEHLRRAQLLVDLPQDAPLAIPSKLFDYLSFNAWVLALARRGSAPERVLRGTGVDLVGPDDVARIKDILRRRYLMYRAGFRPRRLADGIPQYSRHAQAETLFSAIEGMVSRARRQTPGQ